MLVSAALEPPPRYSHFPVIRDSSAMPVWKRYRSRFAAARRALLGSAPEVLMDHRSAPRPVRVLHVLNELRASGAEVMLRSSATQWKVHGVEADVLAVASTPGPFAGDLRTAGYGIAHEVDAPLSRVPARLRRKVQAGRYDVVHLHAERANFCFALAALSTGTPVVRTVHGLFGFRGLLRAERTLQRLVLRRMGMVHVCVGHGVADNERHRFRNPSEVIENWYDSSFVPPTPRQRDEARNTLGLGDGDLVAVSVGNCAMVKRHEVILEAVAHPAGPPNLVYLHVGEEDATRGERQLAARLGISDRTRFLGRRHPLTALHAADVFVMSSAHEGLGLAAVEALATGLPSVLADVPGLREVAGASPVALLTDIDPGRLAGAIGRAALLPVGTAGPEDFRALQERFGMVRGVARYAEIYRRLASSREYR